MTTRTQILAAAGAVALALGTVVVLGAAGDPAPAKAAGGHDHAAMQAAAGGEAGPVRLDAEAARRIGVTYATAAVKDVTRAVETVGTVTYDETRVTAFNPKVEGWVERLYVDFTGAPVRRGQAVMEVYSPMLVAAQEELILARRLADQSRAAGGERALANAEELLSSARRRLRFLDVSAAEVERIERAGTVRRTVTLSAPAGGVVVEKNVVEGTRVMPGMDLLRIADLSTVWVEGEVFEKDLALVRVGQHAGVAFEAYPGEAFHGRVSYVYPDVSLESRTARVRIALDNPGQRLKPGMYARVSLDAAPRTALVVPRSAVHATGARAMVFVRAADGALVPRDVVVGPVVGEEIEVVSGLPPGEVVVASANFLVDAESSMGGSMPAASQPSADAAPAAAPPSGHAH